MAARRKKRAARKPSKWTVFVSHAGTDTWVACQIAAHLEAAGAVPFLDEAHIAVGEDFEERMLAGLEEARELLVLLTPWALQRPYVWVELVIAWRRGIPIVGVLHGLTVEALHAEKDVPVFLKRRDLITINELGRYFEQLKGRIAQES